MNLSCPALGGTPAATGAPTPGDGDAHPDQPLPAQVGKGYGASGAPTRGDGDAHPDEPSQVPALGASFGASGAPTPGDGNPPPDPAPALGGSSGASGAPTREDGGAHPEQPSQETALGASSGTFGAPTPGDGNARPDQPSPAPAPAPPQPPLGTQLAGVPVLKADDIGHFRGSGMRKEAHRWLAHLRQCCAHKGWEVIDITNGLPDGVHAFDWAPTPVFDWKRYVCSLPHAWTLVGDGVTRFEGRFLNSPEPNARKLLLPEPYGGYRFDFVMHLMDGKCVRLHPSHSAEAQPITGQLEPWLVQTCAPTPGFQPPDDRTSVHAVLGPVDVISSETAHRILADRMIAAAKQGGFTPQMFSEDVLENDWFDWVRFLKARPFGRELLKEGVTSLMLKGSDSTPADPTLVVTTEAHPADRVISFQGGCATLN